MEALTAWRGGCWARSAEMEAEGHESVDGGAAAWMEGLRVPQDTRVNSPISSLVSAEEAEATGAAASPQPPGPPAERCWRPPPPLAPSQSLAAAAAGARHRGRRCPGPAPIPASRPHLHAFPRSRHGRLAAPRDAAWGRGRLGGERGATRVPRQDPSKASRGAGSAWVPPLGPPTPPRSPLPSVRCTALGLGGGASEPSSLPGIPPPPPCLEAPNPRAWGSRSRSRTWGHSQGGRGL